VNLLFQLLGETRSALLENSVAAAMEAWLLSVEELGRRHLIGPVSVILLDPLISCLRRQVLPIAPAAKQSVLSSPPEVVRSGT
jgi:hypothetical protein